MPAPTRCRPATNAASDPVTSAAGQRSNRESITEPISERRHRREAERRRRSAAGPASRLSRIESMKRERERAADQHLRLEPVAVAVQVAVVRA